MPPAEQENFAATFIQRLIEWIGSVAVGQSIIAYVGLGPDIGACETFGIALACAAATIAWSSAARRLDLGNDVEIILLGAVLCGAASAWVMIGLWVVPNLLFPLGPVG